MRYKLILIVMVVLLSCNQKLNQESNEIDLVMKAYQAGWTDGANAAAHSVNNNEGWGPVSASIIFKKDSLALLGLLKSKR